MWNWKRVFFLSFFLLSLESVHLQLVCLDEAGLGEPVADLVALVALKLEDLAILGVLHHGAVAGKLLEKR